MNTLVIAYYTALKYLRNFLILLFFVVGTIALIALTASGAATKPDQLDQGYRERVVYLIEDGGDDAKALSCFLNSDKMKKNADLKKVSSYSEGVDQIKNGETDSFIYAGKEFSESLHNHKKSSITVLSAKKVSVAKTAVEGFVNENNAVGAVNQNDIFVNQRIFSQQNLKTQIVETRDGLPESRDTGSLSIMLTMMFYGALFSAYSLIYDGNKRTYIRLRTAPLRYVENISGRILGTVGVMTLFELAIILFSKLFLHIQWEGSLIMTLIPLILFSIIISSFGIIAAGISKNIFICGLSVFAVDFLLAYSVQSQAINPGVSSAFDPLMAISPHNYAFRAIIGNEYSQTAYNVWLSILVLSIMALVLTSVSFAAGRRRMA